MGSLKDLLEEYDRLGDAGPSHDFMLRQRRLEDWAAKARAAIAGLVRANAEPEPARGAPPRPGAPAPDD